MLPYFLVKIIILFYFLKINVHCRFTTKAKIPMIFWLQLTGINNQKCFAIELMKGFGLDISIFFHAINTYNSCTTLYHLKEIISH